MLIVRLLKYDLWIPPLLKYDLWIPQNFASNINPLNANPTKWSDTLKQFVSNLPTNCLSVFYHFVILALKGLSKLKVKKSVYIAKSRQRYHLTLNDILLHVSNHALKDMYILNYGTF